MRSWFPWCFTSEKSALRLGAKGPVLLEYKPEIFHGIRDTYGISKETFTDAWREGIEFKINDGGSSKAFFFFSSDKRFIVKSCTPGEMDVLTDMAESYAEHLDMWPGTFLARIYGAYNLVVYGTEFRFFVMENLFFVRRDNPVAIHERYDIKGSWVNRNFSVPKVGQSSTCRLCDEKYIVAPKGGRPLERCRNHAQGDHVPNVILKDNDLFNKFQISSERAIKLSTQMQLDSHFLEQHNIMDYSLLVGIHNEQVAVTWQSLDTNYEPIEGEWGHLLATQKGRASDEQDVSPSPRFRDTTSGRHKSMSRAVSLVNLGGQATTQAQDCCIEATSIVGPYTYYFGIIDMLQTWTWEKKLERYFKWLVLRNDPAGLSAIPAEPYQRRFMARIGAILNLTNESGPEMRLEPAALVEQVYPEEVADATVESSEFFERISAGTLRQRRRTVNAESHASASAESSTGLPLSPALFSRSQRAISGASVELSRIGSGGERVSLADNGSRKLSRNDFLNGLHRSSEVASSLIRESHMATATSRAQAADASKKGNTLTVNSSEIASQNLRAPETTTDHVVVSSATFI
jgi:1-phosphatidylinositol-4-phosphate 5-kinase